MPTLWDDTELQELRTRLRGTILCPHEGGYDAVRKLWNGRLDRRPALIVRCVGAADVMQAVRFARDQQLVVAVNAGGNSVFPHAVCDAGLMIDLSPMKSVRVDPVRQTARAEPGVLLGEFDHETQAFGLATTTGVMSTVGLAGLTLGGGIGRLGRKYGLTCDNLLSVDIVTADGRLLVANEKENADLFWGVRGGGGNFGIVTSFEYQLHPVGPTVLACTLIHPLSEAHEVLTFYDAYARSAPDEVSVDALIAMSPEGEPVIEIAACYIGSLDAGERILQPLRQFGTPLMNDLHPIVYIDLQALGDGAFPAGMHYYWTSQFMTEISPAAIDTLVSQFAHVPSNRSAVLFQQLGGAISRIDPTATAFYHRDAEYDCIMISAWTDPAESDTQTQWARDIGQAMGSFMSAGFYLNNLCDESEQQVRAAYGENYDRLVSLKNTYDPTNLFRLNANITPTD